MATSVIVRTTAVAAVGILALVGCEQQQGSKSTSASTHETSNRAWWQQKHGTQQQQQNAKPEPAPAPAPAAPAPKPVPAPRPAAPANPPASNPR